METINLTCIGCPMGCPLTVTMENGEVKDVTGNTCKRGDDDAVSVKTKSDIPKGKIFDVCRALKGVAVPAPVKIGDVIIKDVAGTGVDIIATKQVDKA